MTYPQLNGTLMGNDLMYLFVYANSVTNGWFVFMTVIAFFFIIFLSSLFFQMRFSGRIRPEVSFLASSIATLGYAAILIQENGLIEPVYFFVLIGMTILGIIWVSLTSE